MSSLNIRTARAVIWFTRVKERQMTERRMHRLQCWLALRDNKAAFESVRAAWHNSPPITSPPSSHKGTDFFKRFDSSRHPLPEFSPFSCNAERVRLVSEEAAYWYFLCVDNAHRLDSRRLEFLAWMRRSPENIAELFKVAQFDGKLRRLKLAMRSLGLKRSNVIELTITGSPYALHRKIQALEEKDTEDRDPVNKRTLRFKLACLATALLVGVAVAFVAQDSIQSEQVVATDASQWQHMALPDGSSVHVDAHSKVEVAYTDQERIVYVEEGSAVFHVAKDPKRPFIARTPLVDAVAVGTRFSVSIHPGVTTTVSEGVVKITGRGDSLGRVVMLKAGEELRVSDQGLTAPHFVHAPAERKLQRANDPRVFEDMTVAKGAEH